MKRITLLELAFSTVALLGILHFVASYFYFYWTVWWFDILMHLLGGFAIGLFLLWAYFGASWSRMRLPSRREAVRASIFSVLVVAIGWEVFEYVGGITQTTKNYSLDTVLDLIFGIIGAWLAGIAGSKKRFYN